MSDLTERIEDKSKENDDFFQLKWLEGELYEASGENENARNIFIELYEDNPSLIFDAEQQNRIKRLNIDISEIAKALNAEMEESYSRTIQ